jgi:carboxylesterase type B
MGAYHFSDLPLVMGTHAEFRGNSTPFEYALSETIQDYWLAFIKDPDHGLTAAGWPEYNTSNKTMLILGEGGKLIQSRSATIVDEGLAAIGC